MGVSRSPQTTSSHSLASVLCLALLLAILIPPCAGAQGRDVTFFVVADTHYGLSQWDDNEAPNKATIDAMNSLPGQAFPPNVGGGTIPEPRGVLVAGDLTDSGVWLNWYGYRLLHRHDGFSDDYGVNGEGRLRFPVYETYGNHDIHNRKFPMVPGRIRKRNQQRKGIYLAENGLHYAWDWDDVHFINAGIFAGGPGDAHDSLAFLKKDLAERVGDSGRPVVLYQHYGFDPWSKERWWSDDDRKALRDALEGYNLIAIFNGHKHATQHWVWEGIDVYAIANAREGRFYAARITDTALIIAERAGQDWGSQWRKALR